jgi:ABC-type transport system, involved in lipoprotein release, permease component
MIGRLALRNIVLRPWRSAFLLLGYSLGVAVMIVLLSIGEALLTQARDEKLVGGGDVTVLPEGIDIEVLKTGGLGGMFFSIDHSRFVYQQLLASPRFTPFVTAVAPQIEGKLLYARTLDGREWPVMASGEIPSATTAVGAMPPIAEGEWGDDGPDRTWVDPQPNELYNAIDHFHLPPSTSRGDPTWAEWHYFNVLSPDHQRWAFISLIVAGQVPGGKWGGQVLVTLHTQGGPTRKFVATMPATAVRLSTSRADLAIGNSNVTVLADGRYAVRAKAAEEGGNGVVDVSLVVAPSPRAYFPGAALSSDAMVSGYVVPALRAVATGSICVSGTCEQFDGAQAYHDHNWGVWRGVTWEWGAARAGPFTLLYGRVQPADSAVASQPLFVYVVDSLGFLGVFRPKEIRYDDSRIIRVDGQMLHVPARGEMVDVRGDDTLRVELTVEDATATDTRTPGVERGEGLSARGLEHPYFIQMKGTMKISGRVRGRPVSGEGAGFFETYR